MKELAEAMRKMSITCAELTEKIEAWVKAWGAPCDHDHHRPHR